MKLINFEDNDKKYCLMKLDNYNFCVREYLKQPKEVLINGKISILDLKAPDNYFGTLEYATKKAFKILNKQFINKNEFGLFCPTYDPLKSVFEIKPSQVNQNNVNDVIEQLEKAFNYQSNTTK